MKTLSILSGAAVMTIFWGFDAPKLLNFLPANGEVAGATLTLLCLGVLACCVAFIACLGGKKKTS